MWIEDPKAREYSSDVRYALFLIGLLCLTFAFLLGLIA